MGLNDSSIAERGTYARWLAWGTRIGLTCLIAGFLAYALGLIEPFVPLRRLPELWAMPVDRYLAASGAASGWDWLRLAGRSDYLNLLAVAWLALITVACYLRIVPHYWRCGERLQAALAMAQVLVLLAAASGWLATGH